jgi:hypothetical protein
MCRSGIGCSDDHGRRVLYPELQGSSSALPEPAHKIIRAPWPEAEHFSVDGDDEGEQRHASLFRL